MIQPDTFAGAAIYVPVFLRYVYDPVVLGLYCPYAWNIPSSKMREFFNRHIVNTTLRNTVDETMIRPGSSKDSPCRILDIGVGTGYFLEHAPLPAGSEVHLVDLNRAALHAAGSRTMAAHPTTTCQTSVADFLDPGRRGLRCRDLGGGSFDVISTTMLLHCLPGPPARKADALVHLRHLLAPEGTLFGMTILGRGVKHNIWGKQLMFWHNLLGTFGNTEDNVEGFVGPLKEAFADVKWEVHGKMLLFEARKPKV
ncbi:methyltransferase domain-containing protein [Colletotrichum graminicola]|uniref:Methyltransferase domain-containing protein n=1 Tax=Colletotrichum graminicola (strain M1.001 / M2 / FGSC 10212) TaxID=645133 RepID=E3QIJ9_COLGM|nr:methyltransferase domain-containing protein [Colletotrichum graminicola M1.001]EFQ30609.1 methyltransferase domain-containing protein [Colletotrichum graminicola M1.001]WDK21335.1 methyltransferase domain-containing protein [Colletotrichum graminicola]